jgi:hypothetical protein
MALLDSAFCGHLEAGVLGAISDFALIFCSNKYVFIFQKTKKHSY